MGPARRHGTRRERCLARRRRARAAAAAAAAATAAAATAAGAWGGAVPPRPGPGPPTAGRTPRWGRGRRLRIAGLRRGALLRHRSCLRWLARGRLRALGRGPRLVALGRPLRRQRRRRGLGLPRLGRGLHSRLTPPPHDRNRRRGLRYSSRSRSRPHGGVGANRESGQVLNLTRVETPSRGRALGGARRVRGRHGSSPVQGPGATVSLPTPQVLG